MLLSQLEVNIMLVAGFYKAIPANLSEDLGGDTSKSLLQMNLLKTNRSKTACRLSNQGIELLADAGYEFRADKHPIGDGDLLTRRLQSAEIAMALQQIGVDVFLSDMPRKPGGQNYLSAYALRKSYCSNVLGMAKFNGYYFAPETTYIIYHLGSKLSGFYPRTESEIFWRHMMSIESDKRYLFMGGRGYAEMFGLFNRKKESKLKNDCNFRDAIGVFGKVGLLPLNSTGLRILRIMSVPDYKRKIAAEVKGATETEGNPIADGITASNECVQVNLDNNIIRLKKAAENYDRSLVVIPKQSTVINAHPSKVRVLEVDLDLMEDILEIGNPPDLSLIPFIGKNGKGINLVERRAYA